MKRFWNKLLSLGLMLCLLLTGIPSAGALVGGEDTPPAQTSSVDWRELLHSGQRDFTLPEEGTYAPNRLLVTRVDSGMRMAQMTGDGIIGTSTLFTLPMPQEAQEAALMAVNEETTVSCTVVSLTEGSDIVAVMEDLSRQEGVLAVEFDRLRTVSSAEPEAFAPARDPLVAQQTWLDFMGATKAWDMLATQGKVPGEGVTVAVVDSGITQNHPDLKDQIAPGGLRFYLVTDNDGVATVTRDENYEDDHGHGTHVSGIIAGAKNGTGITGVAYGAKILPIKVLDSDGLGYDSTVYAGMLYAAGLMDETGASVQDPVARCQIANMSLGDDSGAPSLAMEIAVDAMRSQGILLVVSAGNNETATSYVHPANTYTLYKAPAYVTGAFAVMAMQETPSKNGDYLANFSNWDSNPYAGAEYTLMAPGSKMLSSINTERGTYTSMSGTSMASPAVAGAAALVLSANPGYSTEDLWSVLATSGQKRQGKTDKAGNKYSYHILDVVAALNTNPDTVKSVVKGNAEGNWTEVPALDDINNSALVIPTDGSKPQVSLTLRGYDGEAFNISATGEGLILQRGAPNYLAPGSEAEMVFTLTEVPNKSSFKTDITVTWRNADGSAGSETVPVKLRVMKAAQGDEINDIATTQEYAKKEIQMVWIFEKPTKVTINPAYLPEDSQEPDLYVLWNHLCYFGEAGSLKVEGDIELALLDSAMIDPQLSGNVSMASTVVTSMGAREEARSTINVNSFYNCTIEDYPNLDLTVDGAIEYSTIANCKGATVTASSVFTSSLVNNFSFKEGPNLIEITVTELTEPDSEGTDPTGFYGNAVVGPAKVLYKASATAAVPATALDCYYLPTASEGDNRLGLFVNPDINKLDCAGTSNVYTEGVDTLPRPAMLEECPTFLISTKRVDDERAVIGGSHLSYRLESKFSRYLGKVDFGYTSLCPPYGNALAENIQWAEDGLSCTYTVYTGVGNRNKDDFYALTDLPIPQQLDFINPIHNRTTEQVELEVTAVPTLQGDAFEIAWTYPDGFNSANLTSGEVVWYKNPFDFDDMVELPITREEINACSYTLTLDDKIQAGSQYLFYLDLFDGTEESETVAIGDQMYYAPYSNPGDGISLHGSEHTPMNELAVSGTDSATVALCAERSLTLCNGLRATVTLDGHALELKSVAPSEEIFLFSGVAQQGNTAVVEIAPTGIPSDTNRRDQYIFAEDTIAALTFRGKNVTGEGSMKITLTDFFGKPLVDVDGQAIAFSLATKTTAVSSSGGDYTPPKKDTTTQTLPDGTLVTTTTNPDGSIQIVYKRPDGVRATVKTPAKGEQSTASISVPDALAGKGVKVPISVAQGSVTTVAVLVGADGKEQVIPGSFWKDGVLTVPLTGSANIIIRDNAKSFADVAADHWGADAIAFASSRELFNGGDGGFQPGGDMTRSMLVTVLARLDGQDTTTGERWDSVGAAWAKEQGISDGSGMESAITREQLAVMLYRYAKAEKTESNLSGFTDAAGVSAWAQDAVQWAVKNGIINGTNGDLNPQGNASRAEVAAMLERFVPLA